VPLRTNPSGIGSSNAFAALADTHTQDEVLVKDIAANTFSFALQNVADENPQRVLPRVDEPILTLVTNEVHDDVISHEGDRMLLGVDVTRSPVSFASPLSLVEHVDVQEELNADQVDIIPASNASNQTRL